jgi:hypothetical protein
MAEAIIVVATTVVDTIAVRGAVIAVTAAVRAMDSRLAAAINYHLSLPHAFHSSTIILLLTSDCLYIKFSFFNVQTSDFAITVTDLT